MADLTEQDVKNLKQMDKRMRPAGDVYDDPTVFKRKSTRKPKISTDAETADFVGSFTEVRGRAPNASEIQQFQRTLKMPKKRGRPKKSKVIQMKKTKKGIHIPKESALVPKSTALTRTPEPKTTKVQFISHKLKPKKDSWLSRRKAGIKAWGGRRKEGAISRGQTAKEKGRVAWRNRQEYYDTTRAGIRTGGRVAVGLGYALPAPFQIFTLAWQKASTTMKWLVILVFLLAILFVPWGIFYYAGWAMAAAVMFLISVIYWVFINIFNGIGTVMVAIINGIVSIIMYAIIWVVEFCLKLVVTESLTKWVPDPLWASRYDGDPWTNERFLAHESGFALEVNRNYWFDGHMILEGSLIRYDLLANVPSLYVIVAPKWESWMYEPLIVKMFQYIPGLQGIADGLGELNRGIAGGFATFVDTAEGWQVVLVGLMPIMIIIAIVLFVYYRNRHYVYG